MSQVASPGAVDPDRRQSPHIRCGLYGLNDSVPLKDLYVDDVGVTLGALFDLALSFVAHALIETRGLEVVCREHNPHAAASSSFGFS